MREHIDQLKLVLLVHQVQYLKLVEQKLLARHHRRYIAQLYRAVVPLHVKQNLIVYYVHEDVFCVRGKSDLVPHKRLVHRHTQLLINVEVGRIVGEVKYCVQQLQNISVVDVHS